MTKTITLTIDEAIHEKAKEVSKKVLGKQNVSGIFTVRKKSWGKFDRKGFTHDDKKKKFKKLCPTMK